jgi:hypothetical protein
MIAIRVTDWDSGCLPRLLGEEILKVQSRLSTLDWSQKIEERFYAERYLAQLIACKKAVELARG